MTVTFESPGMIPNTLKCPLTKKLMRNPSVFAVDGKTYERSAICAHIMDNYEETQARKLIDELKPDMGVRQEILKRFE